MRGTPIEKASTVIKDRIAAHQKEAEEAIAEACRHEHTAKKRRENAETHIKAAKELGEMLKTVEAAERVGGFVDSVLAQSEAELAEMRKDVLAQGIGAVQVQAEGDAITMRHVDIRAGDEAKHWDKPISADLLTRDRE